MTAGSGPPRAAYRIGIAALAYSTTMTALLVGASIAVAVPTLIRGRASAPASMVALGLVVSATCAVLIARHADLQTNASTRNLLAVGIGAAGATVGTVAAIAPAVAGNAFGTTNLIIAGVLIMAGVGFATMLVAWPLAGWLASADRLSSIASNVVRPASGVSDVPQGTEPGFTTADWAILAGGVVALLAGLLVVIPTGPFGHDESIYALKAREWISGMPATGWGVYRPIGMSIVGWIVLQFSSSEVWFRFAAILLSVATVATMWIAGRLMFSRATGTLGAAVFMTTESFLRRATEFLNDVIAAGLMLAAMTVIWIHFERSPTRWWLVAVAPLGAGAYYMRYGSALGLVIIAIVSAVIWGRQLLASWRQIVVTGFVMVVLLVPHFIHSKQLTGTVLGIFEAARTSVGGGGGGLADYVRWLPSHLAGPAGTMLMAMAVIYAVVVVIAAVKGQSGLAQEVRTVGFTTATSLLLAIALGAFTHGEPRFLYLPLMLVLLTGARAVTLVWSLLRRSPRMTIGVAATVVFVAGFAAGALHMGRALDGITDSRDVLVGASAAARLDANGQACVVRSSYIPQITWYAECSTFSFTAPLPQDRPAYLMLFENGKRQPVGSELDAEIAATGGTILVVVDDPDEKIGDAAVFEYP